MRYLTHSLGQLGGSSQPHTSTEAALSRPLVVSSRGDTFQLFSWVVHAEMSGQLLFGCSGFVGKGRACEGNYCAEIMKVQLLYLL